MYAPGSSGIEEATGRATVTWPMLARCGDPSGTGRGLLGSRHDRERPVHIERVRVALEVVGAGVQRSVIQLLRERPRFDLRRLDQVAARLDVQGEVVTGGLLV